MLTLLYASPILCLLVCLLILKLSTIKSGIISFFLTLIIFVVTFKPGILGTIISIVKGYGLALFVILIIWGAMFLYNMVNETKALNVINRNIEMAINDKFYQFILLSWVFAPFLQGIAGFGVPVIVVASILISLGFDPISSACAVLIGHSWAISFGSMGASIYAIDMVTRVPGNEIVVYMALFGIIGMLFTGLTVCFTYGGMKYVAKGLPFIIAVSIVMGIVLNILARIGMMSVIGLLTGLSGVIAGFFVSKIREKKSEPQRLYSAELNLFQAMLPYLLIVFLSVTFFILDPTFSIDLNFPGYTTQLGHVVPYETSYVSFNILKFPFTVIMLSSLISGIVFYKKGTLNISVAKSIINKTVKKCLPTTITLLFLLSMTVLMIDSGMIEHIAVSLANATNNVYPLLAPFIGVLGSFITGSNTNSNIIFGSLQEIAATSLGMKAVVMCAAQSIGASVGAALSPTVVSLGAATANVQNNESQIYRKNILPILLIVLLIGIANLFVIT